MRSKGLAVFAVCLILLVMGVLGWRYARKMIPPFEEGIHSSTVEAQTNRSGVDGPHIGNCPVLPKDNVWNTPVDKLQKDQRADAYIDSIGPLHKVHMDFGSGLQYGIPYTEIPAGTRRVSVEFEYHDDSDLGTYPIPPDVPIEGGAASHGDRHIIMIDPRRCLLYEMFAVTPQPDGSWKAGSGIKIDLTSNALRPEGKGSAEAGGMAMFPGLIRYDEVMSGEINHALRFTIPHTQGAYIWPARHKASPERDLNVPPMGTRFRLRADFDISKYSKTNQVILTALKRYGMILADNGGALFISGVADKRWDDNDLRKLSGVAAEDFEAVNEADWQMLPDSGRVDPVAFNR
jgi:hypothetical protein